MSSWARMKKNARKQFAEGLRETAPQRERLGREAKRQAPRVAAFALATISEMMRSYRRRPSERPRRRPLRVLVVSGLLVWLVVRALKPRKS